MKDMANRQPSESTMKGMKINIDHCVHWCGEVSFKFFMLFMVRNCCR